MSSIFARLFGSNSDGEGAASAAAQDSSSASAPPAAASSTADPQQAPAASPPPPHQASSSSSSPSSSTPAAVGTTAAAGAAAAGGGLTTRTTMNFGAPQRRVAAPTAGAGGGMGAAGSSDYFGGAGGSGLPGLFVGIEQPVPLEMLRSSRFGGGGGAAGTAGAAGATSAAAADVATPGSGGSAYFQPAKSSPQPGGEASTAVATTTTTAAATATTTAPAPLSPVAAAAKARARRLAEGEDTSGPVVGAGEEPATSEQPLSGSGEWSDGDHGSEAAAAAAAAAATAAASGTGGGATAEPEAAASSSAAATTTGQGTVATTAATNWGGRSRVAQFSEVLDAPRVDLERLRSLAWRGVPAVLRPRVWRLLLSFEPVVANRAAETLRRKRAEYARGVVQFWDKSDADRTPEEITCKQQILVDMPRTSPGTALFRCEALQTSLARLLYVWSIRHPASGYVQGINDLATPFLTVFLAERAQSAGLLDERQDGEDQRAPEWIEAAATARAAAAAAGSDDAALRFVLAQKNLHAFLRAVLTRGAAAASPQPQAGAGGDKKGDEDEGQGVQEEDADMAALRSEIEADTYWCLTALLDGIQDNYTFAQKGIQRMIHSLEKIVSRVDAELVAHLKECGVEFLQFSFRWQNCLLLREVSLLLACRLWDTYFAEERELSGFHVFVCAAFLQHFSARLKEMDFQDLMLFLNKPPTEDWTANEVSMILSQAYQWMSTF